MGWVSGWRVGWPTGWLTGWLIGWRVGWVRGGRVGGRVGWLVRRRIGTNEGVQDIVEADLCALDGIRVPGDVVARQDSRNRPKNVVIDKVNA